MYQDHLLAKYNSTQRSTPPMLLFINLGPLFFITLSNAKPCKFTKALKYDLEFWITEKFPTP